MSSEFSEKDYSTKMDKSIQSLKKDISSNMFKIIANDKKTKLIICNTVREKNGLALSSRNGLLSSENKKKAAIIYKTLIYCKENISEFSFQKIYDNCKKEINSLSLS